MPKKQEIMAGYIRESAEWLANSVTIESAAKAVREYGQQEGYLYPHNLEFVEAIGAYDVDYMQRQRLLDMLAAAKRREFDVLVLSEVRALGRQQVEIFVIYDMLRKYGIRLETIKEKFEDSATGQHVLGLRAAFAEVEVEQMRFRLQRGKNDRVILGQAPNGHPKAAYGYVFIDSDREVKAGYEVNDTIIYVDSDGKEWSEYTIVLHIFELLKAHMSLRGIAAHLNDCGFPTPKNRSKKGIPYWDPSTIFRMISNPIYIGEVWANKYKSVKNPKSGKPRMVKRPKEEWIRLPDAPAIIDRETFEAVQQQLVINKQDSLRSNTHQEEIGLLRSGYIFCGLCNRRMQVQYPAASALKNGCTPTYRCRKKAGKQHAIEFNHNVQIHMKLIDEIAWKKVVTVLKDPLWVRNHIAELRKKPERAINPEDIQATIADLDSQITNLFEFARYARDDTTRHKLGMEMQELERKKQIAYGMLVNIEEDEEEWQEVEEEITKFEAWADRVRPYLTDPEYQPTYEEQRFAVRILGIRAVIFPTNGDYPDRWTVDVTVPEIMKKLLPSVAIQPSISSPSAPW